MPWLSVSVEVNVPLTDTIAGPERYLVPLAGRAARLPAVLPPGPANRYLFWPTSCACGRLFRIGTDFTVGGARRGGGVPVPSVISRVRRGRRCRVNGYDRVHFLTAR